MVGTARFQEQELAMTYLIEALVKVIEELMFGRKARRREREDSNQRCTAAL